MGDMSVKVCGGKICSEDKMMLTVPKDAAGAPSNTIILLTSVHTRRPNLINFPLLRLVP